MHHLDIVVLAAGKGTRMCSDLPKVLHLLAGKPLLSHVLDTATSLNPQSISIIVGHWAKEVEKACSQYPCQWVFQKEQLGTAHALLQALPFLHIEGRTLVLYGDVPLVSKESLQKLIETTPPEAIGLLTCVMRHPHGLGRIIRDNTQKVIQIVEEKDASTAQRQIREINTGIYLLPNNKLEQWLTKIENKNAQKEFYLTDMIKLAVDENIPIHDLQVANESEILGVNDRVQLNHAEREFLIRRAREFIMSGIEIRDPARCDLRGEVTILPGTKIDINVIFEGQVEIGANVTIGPNCYLRDCKISDNAIVLANTIIEESILQEHAHVGPFARIRPGSEVAAHAHVGNFVELKKTYLGEGSKASHLSYLGDAVIGKKVNIGAGTITCNYDGVNKSITEIDDGAFIGSNTALIAPVKIEKGALIGAGSVITVNAPAQKITLTRSKQVTIEKGVPKHLKGKSAPASQDDK